VLSNVIHILKTLKSFKVLKLLLYTVIMVMKRPNTVKKRVWEY